MRNGKRIGKWNESHRVVFKPKQQLVTKGFSASNLFTLSRKASWASDVKPYKPQQMSLVPSIFIYVVRT